MAEFGNGNKRSRDEPAEFPPEAKRFKEADLIFEIPDDDDDIDPNGDLADVIKSLEEEIAAAPVAEEEVDGPPPMLDLGYLLEASDDELGLPPAVGSSPPSTSTDAREVVVAVDEEPDTTAGFDRIWVFEDDVTAAGPYRGLEFEMPTELDDGVMFDGGLFDYDPLEFGPSDAEEFPWRTESVTAV